MTTREQLDAHLLQLAYYERTDSKLHRCYVAGPMTGIEQFNFPAFDEVAEHLDIERDQVVQALGASAAFSAAPLDVSAPGDDATSQDRSARLATDDADLEAAPERIMVRRLIETLPEREREIVRLRFFDELTQEQIAERVGVSQMHVSRLIRRSLASMRDLAGED